MIKIEFCKAFILTFTNYFLKQFEQVLSTSLPILTCHASLNMCAISWKAGVFTAYNARFLGNCSQFLHTWVNLTTNNTGYSGVIICKWDWMLGWIVTRDWSQATVKIGMSSNQSRVMTCECQNKCFIKCYCKQNQTNNKFKHVKL